MTEPNRNSLSTDFFNWIWGPGVYILTGFVTGLAVGAVFF